MSHYYEEIECALLACLLSKGVIDDTTVKIVDKLKPSDFYLYKNSVVYKHILAACQSNRPFDMINIDAVIKKSGSDYEDIGGFGFLCELTEYTFIEYGIESLVEKMKAATKARIFTNELNNSLAKMHGQGEIEDNIKGCLSAFSNLDLEQDESLFKKPVELMSSFIDRYAKRIESDGTLAGFSTGYDKLDSLTCGVEQGDLMGICGKPSSGKTALMMNIMLNALRAGQSCLFFSAEMSEAPVIDRLMSMVSRVDLKSIRTGRFDPLTEDLDHARIGNAIEEIKNFNITVVDKGGLHVSDLEMAVKTHSFKNGAPDWIFADYWQIIKGDGFNTTSQHANTSTRLKALAKEHKTRFVLGAQLRKDAEGFPKMSHIKESGKLEEDADILVFVHSDNEDYKPIKGQMSQVVAAKVRQGEIGIVPVMPHMNIQTFTEVDGDYVPPARPERKSAKKYGKAEI